jgi:Caspase domain
MVNSRRRILKYGVGAGSLLLPLPLGRVWAQSTDALKLIRLPKVALVIGNGRYRNAPQLKNPANDANAMGSVLKSLGFEVTIKIDTAQGDMTAAIQTHIQTLTKRKCVGLFYFAGHALQIAWRNFLLPVDAAVKRMEDIKAQGVDLGSLIDGITKAANPMNVIVLDACRDNPFSRDFRVEQKGLAQIDAPPGTLLAFATSPGNVASDGEGVNGLYTEHLLREIQVKETRIEDVFKRVRLGVRRKSNGSQIPWESTSLEEDFYIQPPAHLQKLSDAEKDRLFKEELAIWERIKNANDPAPLEDYLKRYPSGDFSELAQLRLDRTLVRLGEQKLQLSSQASNPFTKGSAFTRIAKVGDSFTYRELSLSTKVERGVYTVTVTQVTDTEAIHDNGLVTDLLGNQLRSRRGASNTPSQLVPHEFAVGKRWTARSNVTDTKGITFQSEQTIRVLTREEVTVPAGKFFAFLLEGKGRNTNPAGPVEFLVRRWYVPEFQRPVAREEVRRRENKVFSTERLELLSYKLA